MRTRKLLFAAFAIAAALVAGCGDESNDTPDTQAATVETVAAVEPTSDPAVPTDERVKAWATDWCKVRVGMTPDEAVELMGEPTEQYPRSNGVEEQMTWAAAQWHFTAFFDLDHGVRQLDVNEIELTAADKARIPCETTRTGQ